MKNKKLLVLLPMVSLLLAGCNFLPSGLTPKPNTDSSSQTNSTDTIEGEVEEEPEDNPEEDPEDNPEEDPSDVDPAEPVEELDPVDPSDPSFIENYYSSITDGMSGTTLRDKLYDIIHPAKCQTAYNQVWNYLEYCDAAHPERTGSPSNDIIPFYRETVGSKSAMNKEHVWPDSRGGNFVEGDPHMTRPTFNADNSSRGNSFYVEGLATKNNTGWDPKAANMSESFRGDAARIIFYCAVQEKTKLTLIDENVDSTSNKTMGKLSDLLKWNIEYPVHQREMNRNDILSGVMTSYGKSWEFNRNPFIDHPEYACKIWGTTNSTTRQICGM